MVLTHKKTVPKSYPKTLFIGNLKKIMAFAYENLYLCSILHLNFLSVFSMTFKFMLLKRVQGFGKVSAEDTIVSWEVYMGGLDVRDDGDPLLRCVLAGGALVAVRPIGLDQGADHRLYVLF